MFIQIFAFYCVLAKYLRYYAQRLYDEVADMHTVDMDIY